MAESLLAEKSLHSLTLSAQSLTIFDLCPKLFRYLYLDHYFRPTSTKTGQHGTQFHRLVELYSKGHNISQRLQTLDPIVRNWWQIFSRSEYSHPEGKVYTEIPVWTEIHGFLITARMDRIVIHPSELIIFDWKTQKTPLDPKGLAQSWQVRLYPLLVCLIFSYRPEQVRMTIWNPHQPKDPYQLLYSSQHLTQDQDHLQATLSRLQHYQAHGFPLTSTPTLCTTCPFRIQCYGLPAQVGDSVFWEIYTSETVLQIDP